MLLVVTFCLPPSKQKNKRVHKPTPLSLTEILELLPCHVPASLMAQLNVQTKVSTPYTISLSSFKAHKSIVIACLSQVFQCQSAPCLFIRTMFVLLDFNYDYCVQLVLKLIWTNGLLMFAINSTLCINQPLQIEPLTAIIFTYSGEYRSALNIQTW